MQNTTEDHQEAIYLTSPHIVTTVTYARTCQVTLHIPLCIPNFFHTFLPNLPPPFFSLRIFCGHIFIYFPVFLSRMPWGQGCVKSPAFSTDSGTWLTINKHCCWVTDQLNEYRILWHYSFPFLFLGGLFLLSMFLWVSEDSIANGLRNTVSSLYFL